MGSQTPEDGKVTVQRALDGGFKGIKIKCKIEEPIFDRLSAMRDVAGSDFKVTVDPNERFRTAEQTIELSEELQKLGNVEVSEDPIPKSDLDGYRQIHDAIDIPVAMHLGDGPRILGALKAGVVDCFNLGEAWFAFRRTPPSRRLRDSGVGTDQASTSASVNTPIYTRSRRPRTVRWHRTSWGVG